MYRKEYEENLKATQRAHLDRINGTHINWTPCLHDQCQSCHGTGLKSDGGFCIHGISCSCQKCSIK